MANNSVVTQEVLQRTIERYHEDFVYPYQNGATHAGFTPVGSVIAIMGNEAPNHYLACDGTAYNISEYSDLANFFEDQFGSKNYFGGDGTTTFAVPDLRGEFLRGTGINSHENQGNGADVGVHQDSTRFPDYGSLNNGQYVYKLSNAYGIANADKVIKRDILGLYLNSNLSGSSTPDVNVLMNVRPTNTSVLYCIAYKNIYIDSLVGGFPVDITNPQDKQGLTFDATNNKWVNGAGGMHEYSTDEKVVGKWVDGKSIYEKTVIINVPSDYVTTNFQEDNTLEVIHDISGLNIFTYEGFAVYDGNKPIQIPSAWGNEHNGVYGDLCSFARLAMSGDALIFSTNRTFLNGSVAYITLHYTKKTD